MLHLCSFATHRRLLLHDFPITFLHLRCNFTAVSLESHRSYRLFLLRAHDMAIRCANTSYVPRYDVESYAKKEGLNRKAINNRKSYLHPMERLYGRLTKKTSAALRTRYEQTYRVHVQRKATGPYLQTPLVAVHSSILRAFYTQHE